MEEVLESVHPVERRHHRFPELFLLVVLALRPVVLQAGVPQAVVLQFAVLRELAVLPELRRSCRSW
jgi:hypothetical protein